MSGCIRHEKNSHRDAIKEPTKLATEMSDNGKQIGNQNGWMATRASCTHSARLGVQASVASQASRPCAVSEAPHCGRD